MHTPLTDRKALAIRMLATRIFTNLPRLDKSAQAEYAHALSTIDLYSKKSNFRANELLDEFLNNGAENLQSNSEITACSKESVDLLREFNSLCEELGKFKCNINSKNGKVCDNNGSDVFDECGVCLRELTFTYDFVKDHALNFLKSIASCAVAPNFRLATNFEDLNDGANINGSYDWRRKEISIIFTRNAFDEDALFQMLYIIAHEIYCHGLQGVLGQPKDAATSQCTWTEGFMDRVVILHTRDLLMSTENQIPIWLANCRTRALEACEKLHRHRTSILDKDFEYVAYDRRRAWEACDELSIAFRADSPDNSVGTTTLFEFANLLNFKVIDKNIRNRVVSTLIALMDARMRGTEKHSWAIRACKNFTLYSDLLTFINDIGRIAGVELLKSS